MKFLRGATVGVQMMCVELGAGCSQFEIPSPRTNNGKSVHRFRSKDDHKRGCRTKREMIILE
jgi:hypothetical protein